MSIITVERKILEKNDAIAARNREWFARRGMFALNLVSSPGAGKTALLERTLERWSPPPGIAIVEGDVQTDLDARRVARYGVPVVQIVTNGGCHLEAPLVADALARLEPGGAGIVIIENVGNLVCPAGFDLGECRRHGGEQGGSPAARSVRHRRAPGKRAGRESGTRHPGDIGTDRRRCRRVGRVAPRRSSRGPRRCAACGRDRLRDALTCVSRCPGAFLRSRGMSP